MKSVYFINMRRLRAQAVIYHAAPFAFQYRASLCDHRSLVVLDKTRVHLFTSGEKPRTYKHGHAA